MKQAPADRIDTDVKIPAAVKAAAARSESFYQAPPEGDEANKEEAPDGGTAREPKAPEPEAKAEDPAEGTIEPPAPPKDAPGVTPQGNPPASEDDWQHRYNSMKGRYDRAQADLRSQADRITHLENMLATIEVKAPAKAETAPAELQRLVTPEMEAEWGQEFLEVVAKKAQEVYQPLVSSLENKVKTLELQLGKVGGHIAGDARSRMLGELDSKVPSWKEINTNENFLAWLQLPDTYSGAIRHKLLKEAFERNDSPRVAAFFNGFLAEEAAVAPVNRGPDPAEAKPSSKVPLENFAAPGRAKSAAATAPAEKPTITRAQISSFYADMAAGKYRGKEEEAARLEKQIFEAQREGRIR